MQLWRTVRDALADLPEPDECDCLLFPGHVYQPGARCYPGHTGSGLDFPAKTIYRFLGSWSDCMKQIGNAVPVQLAQCVIAALLSTLSAVCRNA